MADRVSPGATVYRAGWGAPGTASTVPALMRLGFGPMTACWRRTGLASRRGARGRRRWRTGCRRAARSTGLPWGSRTGVQDCRGLAGRTWSRTVTCVAGPGSPGLLVCCGLLVAGAACRGAAGAGLGGAVPPQAGHCCQEQVRARRAPGTRTWSTCARWCFFPSRGSAPGGSVWPGARGQLGLGEGKELRRGNLRQRRACQTGCASARRSSHSRNKIAAASALAQRAAQGQSAATA